MARAEKFSAANLRGKALNGKVEAHWLPGKDSFWFHKQNTGGHEFLLVDAATGNQRAAFDHQALAAALDAGGERGLNATALPIGDVQFLPDGWQIQLEKPPADINVLGGRSNYFLRALSAVTYRCDVALERCQPVKGNRSILDTGEAALRAPDGERAVYVRDHNLWLRDRKAGASDRQLTQDGVAHFAYGAWDEECQDGTYVARRRTGTPLGPNWVQWSPDSRYLVAMRIDLRDTPNRILFTENALGRDRATVPNMRHFPIASDNKVLTRVVTLIDTQTGQSAAAKVDAARLQDWAAYFFNASYMWWNIADKLVYLITGTKNGRRYGLVAVNLDNGDARMVVEEEESQHYIFSGNGGKPNFYVTAAGDEAVWYSQRSGSGHLYLYDARTGKLKNPITQGDWTVLEIVRVDEPRRQIYFTAGGREPGLNPYFSQLYRIGFDGGKVERLTPEPAHHSVSLSGSGRYFVDTYSTITTPPVTVIRRSDGRLVKQLLKSDTSKLGQMGWKPPVPFTVKAADERTDLYGVMYQPTNFDPSKKYAIVEQTYPGPDGRYAPRSFMETVVTMGISLQSIADLGFIAVFLDGRGTAGRDRAFQYAFLDTEDAFGAADHKAAIENLARQYPFIDAGRVGIVGASYGGYATVRAALLFPDFFDVSVSSAGPQDWRYMGFPYAVEHLLGLQSESVGGDYRIFNNTNLAARLKGKLFLIYGEVDEQAHLNQAFLMADALVKADKDFDLMIVPNADHGVFLTPYALRRWQRYFVEHLGGPVAR